MTKSVFLSLVFLSAYLFFLNTSGASEAWIMNEEHKKWAQQGMSDNYNWRLFKPLEIYKNKEGISYFAEPLGPCPCSFKTVDTVCVLDLEKKLKELKIKSDYKYKVCGRKISKSVRCSDQYELHVQCKYPNKSKFQGGTKISKEVANLFCKNNYGVVPTPQAKGLKLFERKRYVPHSEHGASDDNSTSFLFRSKLPSEHKENFPEFKWCGEYSSAKIVDKDNKTAWCEGNDDYGEGEIVWAFRGFNTMKRHIEIWPIW